MGRVSGVERLSLMSFSGFSQVRDRGKEVWAMQELGNQLTISDSDAELLDHRSTRILVVDSWATVPVRVSGSMPTQIVELVVCCLPPQALQAHTLLFKHYGRFSHNVHLT